MPDSVTIAAHAKLNLLLRILGRDEDGYHSLETLFARLALADELAGAAEPVMGKLDRIPAAIIRGLPWERGDGSSRALLRDPARDLFR